MSVICKAAYGWGGTGGTPSFNLNVHEVHAIPFPYLASCKRQVGAGSKGCKGPKGPNGSKGTH